MAFRAQEIYKKIVRKVGKDSVPAEMLESVRKCLPNNKLVMGRAKRGIYAGRHIQFGNKVSEDGGNKSRRTWKPNVQTRRLFSYIHDRHIRVKVTTHALRCIDKAGGIDEYLLKTPYHKMETEMGLFWKTKVEKMYEQLGNMEVGFFSPEEEAKIEKGFEELKIAKREARREARRTLAKQRQIEEGRANADETIEPEQIEGRMTDDVAEAGQETPKLS
ncbi:54S ribosomal protein L24, mitochondrial-like [Phoenix dactylifera]|uniref:Large ribosomal subunit protein bL28m n=1 Tax=Phoenix dactylifera TaxID=42345 RepID=A0A8B8ZUF0_PHODC|nr:54S ribosomal protein L24, mitochondrial-like [Phoenix dactylifera]XP_008776119.1 54S ribosomal protein L24, mitochondrial-like [Phoenix dactylifera]XP_038975163.1 54S ribosomal protein L24, mitochondrial-like [Phoenix dactylifera]